MSEPNSDSFARPPSAAQTGYAAQAMRYERFLGWVLWSGLLAVLVLMGL